MRHLKKCSFKRESLGRLVDCGACQQPLQGHRCKEKDRGFRKDVHRGSSATRALWFYDLTIKEAPAKSSSAAAADDQPLHHKRVETTVVHAPNIAVDFSLVAASRSYLDDWNLLEKTEVCDAIFSPAVDHDPYEDSNIDWTRPPVYDIYADEQGQSDLLNVDFLFREPNDDFDRNDIVPIHSFLHGLFGSNIQNHEGSHHSAPELHSLTP
ncbi:OLC1v1036929C1 [Oldenlandia corymbosa var. corymbosa]|uniref:OLC1v1036929C1 n=1 Tax=Oldenlandia corymbosa var. corymbosa TaxID=529605 RepID=A0AAV1CX44_OLDCO|nr:OLC1v1036929C1 [Oldenlandia corymbosa var. corymbosa]